MANFVGQARTNYFAVKDLAAFETALAGCEVEIVTSSDPDQAGLVALLSDYAGGWASTRSVYDAEGDWVDDEDLDLAALVAEHLVEGSVAVFMLVGFEKMRYLTGFAEAVNSKGQSVTVDLETEIMKAAATLGSNVTPPTC